MLPRVLSLCLAFCLSAPAGALAQTAAIDPEIARGIKAVDDGDYDAAILVLDQAVRRLVTAPARARDLSQGYLYLGIAYVGKGHEAAARAKFREALGQIQDLSLSPDKFPPKVIDLFEAARAETRQEAAKPSPKKKGGGGKGVLIGVGVVAAAGAGVALAAGGGGSSSSTAPTTTPAPVANPTEVYQGFLDRGNSGAIVNPPVAQTPGPWRAELTWTGDRTEVRMFIVDAITKDGLTEVRLTSPNASVGEWAGQAGRRYEIELFLQEGGASQSNYTLRVTHPR